MITFTLASEHVRNTVFTDEQGQVIYKTDTPFRFGSRTTTIYKIKPNSSRFDMRDQFDAIGEIEWHRFTSTKFRFAGTEVATKDFIPSRGFTRRKRVFTGPDDRSYRWDLEFRAVVLSRNDRSRAELARSHRATLGIIGKKRKAMLEVSPEMAHMMDTIIMTFIYVEKLREDKEQAAHSSTAAAAS